MASNRYQLWGGCFEEEASSVLRHLNDSLSIDSRLYREDIRGSRAWAQELYESKHLSNEHYSAIVEGLNEVEMEIERDLKCNGRLLDKEEDIHSVVESRLHKYSGESALRLHTARSRNDQSATDTKLWMLNAFKQVRKEIMNLISVITNRAENEIEIIAPGYTHLQRAQPIRWSHFLLSYVWLLKDDISRLEEQLKRVSACPLGSGALAGCALAIDRKRLARNLGFENITHNSMFAVGSRDYIVEFLNWAALCASHLSRLAEDFIIYSTQEFGFVKLSDKFSTGSSLMPQKRNPDGLELIRGTAGLLLGDSFSFSCTLKGLPSTYNKDLQVDKEITFRSFDRLMHCLKVMTGTIKTMSVDGKKASCLLDPGMLATDLAHALVRRGVPFRKAHHIVGAVLKRAEALNVDLQNLPHKEYIAICPEFGSEADLRKIFSWEASVEQYQSAGGTARRSVEDQLRLVRQWMEQQNL